MYKGRWNSVLVAVKVLTNEGPEQKAAFQREAAILRKMRHPNVVRLWELATNAEQQVWFQQCFSTSWSPE